MVEDDRTKTVERTYTAAQRMHIQTYRMIGRSLAAELSRSDDLRQELSELLHSNLNGRERIYEKSLAQYFHSDKRDFRDVISSPIIQAFNGTPLCGEDESNFLVTLRYLATQTPSALSPQLIGEFQAWLNKRLPILAKGFQSCVLDSTVVPLLTEEERARRNSELMKRRWEEDPAKFQGYQELATKAAAEQASPRVFTPEIRREIQARFDRGLDYATVVEILAGMGINTRKSVLRTAVQSYADLHYTPGERKKAELVKFKQAVEDIFEATGSALKTIEILEKLGHTPAKSRYYLTKLGLKNKVYWDQEVKIGQDKKSLAEVAKEFTSAGYGTLREEYEALKSYLNQNGQSLNCSLEAYRAARKRITQGN